MISISKSVADTATPLLKIVAPTPLYGGSLPIAYHAAEAFRDLGHSCEILRFDEHFSLFDKLGTDVDEQSGKTLRSRFAELLADYVADHAICANADLVWYTAQAPVSVASLRRLREAGIKTTLWFVEDVRRFDYWKYIAKEFDIVFTIQVGAAAEALIQAGSRDVAYLPGAANVKMHRPLNLSKTDQQRYGSRVSFVGAGYPNRVTLFDQIKLPDLKLWGNDWPKSWTDRLQESGRRVTAEETALIYNATEINLNIHSAIRDNVLDCGDFVNPRTFEIAACGGFQIVNRQHPLLDMFDPSELAVVDSVEELVHTIAHYSTQPETRRKIAEASRSRVLRDHTYVHRMKSALKHVFRTPVVARKMVMIPTMGDMKAAAHGNQEMQQFLAKFSDDESATLQKLVDKVTKDQHSLSRPELIVLLMHEFRNWGIEKGVIQ